MIKSLNIKNYAIIDDLSIDFDDGFNVFTGETGAGKSIIVGALSLLLKGRSDNSLIRKGANKASIEGIFSLDEDIINKLNEAEIDYDDSLIVRRIISNDNRNIIKVNDTTVTLNFLSNLLGEKIDIHSQKDSHYLLNKKNHLYLLDKYAHNEEELDKYKELYKEYNDELNNYNNLINNSYNQRDYEFNVFDYNEINDAHLKADEEEELKRQEKIYKDSAKYLETLNNSLYLYKEDGGIKEKINALIKSIDIDDNEFQNIKTNIQNYYYNIDDEINKLDTLLNTINSDDIDIDKVEERLYIYSKLKRKHNTDVEGLIRIKDELKEKIDFYNNRNDILKEKEKRIAELKDKCLKEANILNKKRKKAAEELSKRVISEAEELMLNNINFNVDFKKIDLNSNGIDDIEFFISTNKGEELKPLKSVASGGEVSRLMLALKVIFASLANTQSIIFDEIDVGVSGKTALAIGEKMAKLSKDVQVLTITHLAPVAACANNHYYIYKVEDENSTVTRINKLNKEEVIKELANISGSITDDSLNAAKQLYKTAQEKCYGN